MAAAVPVQVQDKFVAVHFGLNDGASLRKIVVALGGKLVDSSGDSIMRITHFVTNDATTDNRMAVIALAAGAWFVNDNWLRRSNDRLAFQKEDAFELGGQHSSLFQEELGNRFGFSLAAYNVRLAVQSARALLFSGFKIYIGHSREMVRLHVLRKHDCS